MSSQQFGSFVLRTKIAYSISFSPMNVKELDISLLHKMLYFFHCICVSSLKNLLRPYDLRRMYVAEIWKINVMYLP